VANRQREAEETTRIREAPPNHRPSQPSHPQPEHNQRHMPRLTLPRGTSETHPKGTGDACLDPAYLSRRNCNHISKKGRSPIIKPKRNTTIRKRGSQPWRDMMTLWFEDEAAFLKRYHQRSKAESVYSALKRCYGNHLSSHKRRAQRRELHLKTLTYNIGIANLTNIRQENG